MRWVLHLVVQLLLCPQQLQTRHMHYAYVNADGMLVAPMLPRSSDSNVCSLSMHILWSIGPIVILWEWVLAPSVVRLSRACHQGTTAKPTLVLAMSRRVWQAVWGRCSDYTAVHTAVCKLRTGHCLGCAWNTTNQLLHALPNPVAHVGLHVCRQLCSQSYYPAVEW